MSARIPEWLLERFRVLGAPGVCLNRLASRLGARVEEAFSFNLACVLEKAVTRRHRITTDTGPFLK